MRTDETARLADGGYASVGEFAWAVARTLDHLAPHVGRGATRDDVLGGGAPVPAPAPRLSTKNGFLPTRDGGFV